MKPSTFDSIYRGSHQSLFHAFFGHVDIKLKSVGLDFSLTKIKSNELDFYEWSLAPPHVACGSQLGPFFPPYPSHSVSSALTPSLQLSQPSSLSHNFPQLSHPLTQHSPQQHSLTGNVLYIFVLQLCYIFIVLCFYNIGNFFC